MAKHFWVLVLTAGLIVGCGDVKSDSSAGTPAVSPAPAPAAASGKWPITWRPVRTGT